MKTKRKNTSRNPTELQESICDPRRAGPIERQAMERVVETDAPVKEESTPENFRKHIEAQTLRAFLDTVTVWGLDASGSARLVGVEAASIEEWKTGKAPASEEILARMTMVALIRTALDISFSSSLSTQWMTLPNSGYPYSGLSPVAYIGEHGWPGLYLVLRQTQASAVGN